MKLNQKGGCGLTAALSFLLAASLILGACSFSGSGDSSSSTASEYEVLSSNSFMGGSLMYSPAGKGQIESGRTFGIRFGSLQKVSTTGDGGTAIEIYEEMDDAERYGTLKINSVSKDSISFTSCIYSDEGKGKSSSSYTLATGESADLDGDGQADITYKEPGVKRTVFILISEGGSFITAAFFLSDLTCQNMI